MRQLVKKDFVVNVEKSPGRIFDDEDFAKEGANLVAEGSWPDAPRDHIIIGLKELPEESCTVYSLTLIDQDQADMSLQ